jgi:hypothetical protein
MGNGPCPANLFWYPRFLPLFYFWGLGVVNNCSGSAACLNIGTKEYIDINILKSKTRNDCIVGKMRGPASIMALKKRHKYPVLEDKTNGTVLYRVADKTRKERKAER